MSATVVRYKAVVQFLLVNCLLLLPLWIVTRKGNKTYLKVMELSGNLEKCQGNLTIQVM